MFCAVARSTISANHFWNRCGLVRLVPEVSTKAAVTGKVVFPFIVGCFCSTASLLYPGTKLGLFPIHVGFVLLYSRTFFEALAADNFATHICFLFSHYAAPPPLGGCSFVCISKPNFTWSMNKFISAGVSRLPMQAITPSV